MLSIDEKLRADGAQSINVNLKIHNTDSVRYGEGMKKEFAIGSAGANQKYRDGDQFLHAEKSGSSEPRTWKKL